MSSNHTASFFLLDSSTCKIWCRWTFCPKDSFPNSSDPNPDQKKTEAKPTLEPPKRPPAPRRKSRAKPRSDSKVEPEVVEVLDERQVRDNKLIDACMANPRWSHVIHYHNKIKKYGVSLDLDTLLHGMLQPSDYKELHQICFGTCFPLPDDIAEEKEETQAKENLNCLSMFT